MVLPLCTGVARALIVTRRLLNRTRLHILSYCLG